MNGNRSIPATIADITPEWMTGVLRDAGFPAVTVQSMNQSENQGGGAGSDLVDYIEYPAAHAPFDFVLIDGRARNACMLGAVDLVSERGVVVLHDANRVRYHDHFDLFKNQALLLDYRANAGGLWVGSNGTEISSLIDMDFHRSLWSSVRTLSRFLGPARRYFLGI